MQPHPNAGSPILQKLRKLLQKAMKLQKTSKTIQNRKMETRKKTIIGNLESLKTRPFTVNNECMAIKKHNPIWYLWDPLVLLAYGKQSMDIAQRFSFKDFNSEGPRTLNIIIDLICSFEIVFNFFRSDGVRTKLRDVAWCYLSFLFWWDFLALFDFEKLLFTFIVIKSVRIRQMVRGGDTLERFVTKLVNNMPLRKRRDDSKFLIGRVVGKMLKVFFLGIMGVFLLSLLIMMLSFRFIEEKYNENSAFFNVFSPAVTYLLTTMTTVGYGDLVPKRAQNQFYTLFFQLGGIILYGYVFQQVLIFIYKSRGYTQMKLERKENLDSWLIRKERKAPKLDNQYQNVIPKTEKAFEFIWKWDIEKIYNSDFFHQLPPGVQTNLSMGPMNYLMRYFSAFFKIFEYQDCLNLSYKLQPRM